MKYSFLSKGSVLLFLIFLCFSCASRKEIVYYQNSDGFVANTASSYEIKIQPDDLLLIVVSAEDPEIAAPFNLTTINKVNNNATLDMAVGQQTLQQYLVDSQGNIEFPILGKLKVGGLSRTEILALLRNKIGQYVKNPIINLRVTNFKVAVQGEVNNPGTFSISSDRLTLVEALSMAKDLTIYGKRNNLLVIREVNGEKTFNHIDITKADFINSPFYYLKQNDVIYVEPNKAKINGAAVGANTSVIISITSLLITLITFIVTTSK